MSTDSTIVPLVGELEREEASELVWSQPSNPEIEITPVPITCALWRTPRCDSPFSSWLLNPVSLDHIVHTVAQPNTYFYVYNYLLL